jgi:hypothetical protein
LGRCTSDDQLKQLQPIMPIITFDALMERSLLQLYWQTCSNEQPLPSRIASPPKAFKWMTLPAADQKLITEGQSSSTSGGNASAASEKTGAITAHACVSPMRVHLCMCTYACASMHMYLCMCMTL